MYLELNLQILKQHLKANVNLPTAIDTVGGKVSFTLAVAILIRLANGSMTSTGSAASRIVEGDLSLGKRCAVMAGLGVPREVLDEADLRTLDTASSVRQRVFTRGCSLASDSVNDSACPSGAASILNLYAVRVAVVGIGYADRTAHSFAAISTIDAAWVIGGAVMDKGRKYEKKHVLAIGVRTALHSGVAKGRVLERVLVGIVEALLVRGIGHVVRECDLSEAVCGSLVKVPVVANEAICQGGSAGSGSGS